MLKDESLEVNLKNKEEDNKQTIGAQIQRLECVHKRRFVRIYKSERLGNNKQLSYAPYYFYMYVHSTFVLFVAFFSFIL